MNGINSLSFQVLCDDEVPTLGVPPVTAIDPRPNHDDEVSTLSFMGDSDLARDRCVPPNPDHRGSYHDEGQDNEEEGREPSVAKSRIDANDFDNRERCRRHPASSCGRRSCPGGYEGPQVQPPLLRGRNPEDENGGGGQQPEIGAEARPERRIKNCKAASA